MKLESSEARKRAAFTISSGSPIGPIGMMDTNWSLASCANTDEGAGVDCAGAENVHTDLPSFRSLVQVRAKERIAALLAL